MSKRVSPTERIHAEISEVFASDRDLGETLEEVARLSVRLMLQTALEAEVTEFLGRERYARGERAREGHRNGHSPVTVKTTCGPITLERPKVRDTLEPFASRLLGTGVTRTNALESLCIAGFVRGLSVRDVQDALRETLGEEATLSRSTVSRICRAIREEFDRWRHRDLSELTLDYLYCDGVCFRMHPGARAEPILCTWGITTEGEKVLVGLAEGAHESLEAWGDHFRELRARGLAPPLLGITDGAPGLCEAFDRVFGAVGSLRQRCLVHKARNVLAKVPTGAQGEVKAAYWEIFDGIEAPPGEAALAEARERAGGFARRFGDAFPAATECVMGDLEALACHLRFPREHWRRVRHTNLLERTFGEARRRVKVIGRLPGERSCLSLVWAVLDRASKGWRGLTQTPAGLRLLQDLRRQLLGSPSAEEVEDEDVTTAA